jgi:hypothetical protein
MWGCHHFPSTAILVALHMARGLKHLQTGVLQEAAGYLGVSSLSIDSNLLGLHMASGLKRLQTGVLQKAGGQGHLVTGFLSCKKLVAGGIG